MTEAITAIDGQILLFIQEHIRCAFLTPVMKFASFIGDAGAVWILAALVLLIVPKTHRRGLDAALCLAVAAIVNNLVIKNLVARPRPFLTFAELELLIDPLMSYSFPSGHACASFAAAFAIARGFRGSHGGWAYLPAAVIALSRIYVGIHYPTDILAGAAVGTLCAWGVCALSQRFIRQDFLSGRKRD